MCERERGDAGRPVAAAVGAGELVTDADTCCAPLAVVAGRSVTAAARSIDGAGVCCDAADTAGAAAYTAGFGRCGADAGGSEAAAVGAIRGVAAAANPIVAGVAIGAVDAGVAARTAGVGRGSIEADITVAAAVGAGELVTDAEAAVTALPIDAEVAATTATDTVKAAIGAVPRAGDTVCSRATAGRKGGGFTGLGITAAAITGVGVTNSLAADAFLRRTSGRVLTTGADTAFVAVVGVSIVASHTVRTTDTTVLEGWVLIAVITVTAARAGFFIADTDSADADLTIFTGGIVATEAEAVGGAAVGEVGITGRTGRAFDPAVLKSAK